MRPFIPFVFAAALLLGSAGAGSALPASQAMATVELAATGAAEPAAYRRMRRHRVFVRSRLRHHRAAVAQRRQHHRAVVTRRMNRY